LLDQIAFVERIEKADMNRALAERSDFLDRGLSQSQHNVCFAQSSHPIINHRSPSVLVFRVAAIDSSADPSLDCNFSAERCQFLRRLRYNGGPFFARSRFLGNKNP